MRMTATRLFGLAALALAVLLILVQFGPAAFGSNASSWHQRGSPGSME